VKDAGSPTWTHVLSTSNTLGAKSMAKTMPVGRLNTTNNHKMSELSTKTMEAVLPLVAQSTLSFARRASFPVLRLIRWHYRQQPHAGQGDCSVDRRSADAGRVISRCLSMCILQTPRYSFNRNEYTDKTVAWKFKGIVFLQPQDRQGSPNLDSIDHATLAISFAVGPLILLLIPYSDEL
jgi:hypothetical protein